MFFTIFDALSGGVVFNVGLLPPTTTTVTLGGGVLEAGHSYVYELIYSDRVNVDTENSRFGAQIGFDLRTDGFFSTRAVPEPSSLFLAVAGAGVVGGGWLRRRRNARSA